jgi:hypothetical protein
MSFQTCRRITLTPPTLPAVAIRDPLLSGSTREVTGTGCSTLVVGGRRRARWTVSDRSIIRALLAAVAALGVGLASCTRLGNDRDDPVDAESAWGQEAVELFDAIARDLTDVDRYAAAAHFGESGMLDLHAWGGEEYAGLPAIAEALGTTLYITTRAAAGYSGGWPDLDVDVDQVFLGAREAVVRFDAHVSPHEALVRFDARVSTGGVPWMQIYAIGENTGLSSRLFTEDLGHLDPAMRWTDAPRHPFYEQYVDVWSSGDPGRLDEVYAGAVVVRNALDGRRWVGLEELAGEFDVTSEIEPGPWPELFRYDNGDRHEQIAVFQFGGSCPALEARRWVFEDGLIVDETRYAHVPSVRRCDGSAGDGWWNESDAAPTDQLTIDSTTIAGHQVDLVNAGPEQADFTRWLLERYVIGSLAVPEVAAVWFPPSVDCGLAEGIAKRDDDRFEGSHTVTLCFTPDGLASGWPNERWSDHAVHQGLHELGHVWMYDHLDEIDQLTFLEQAGLDVWRDVDVFWPQRGVESAAETIAWGLAGTGRAEYLIEPTPSCRELAARYELLTGTEPLTTCEPAGGG